MVAVELVNEGQTVEECIAKIDLQTHIKAGDGRLYHYPDRARNIYVNTFKQSSNFRTASQPLSFMLRSPEIEGRI